MLPPDQFVALRALLRAARSALDSLAEPRLPLAAKAVLAPITERLTREPRAESSIDRVLNEDGDVRDDASPKLRAIRRELRGAEGELIALLERIMSRLDPSVRPIDMSVTVRNGRFVIPVRREGRAELGGIVHDTSASGGTIFVEPPAAVEAGNRMRELAADEVREIDRILFELAETLRPHHASLAASYDALAELDSLYARARYAVDFSASR